MEPRLVYSYERRTMMAGRTAFSARTIVAGGVSSLLLVLLGTLVIGPGTAFDVGAALFYTSLIVVVLVMLRRGSDRER